MRDLFAPYRRLGLVCDGSPSCRPFVQRRGAASFAWCPIRGGRAVHVYDVEKLQLVGALEVVNGSGEDNGEDETLAALRVRDDTAFLAVGSKVCVFERTRFRSAWVRHKRPVDLIEVIGSVLLSISSEERRMVCWEAESGVVVSDSYFTADFHPTAVAHPDTYLNKVLVGAKDGRLQLWNFQKGTMIYNFSSFGSAIMVIASAPVLDVMAIGLADGSVTLLHVREDRVLLELESIRKSIASQDPRNGITSLSFRTDGHDILVTSNGFGDLFTWDLAKKTMAQRTPLVHPEGVAMAEFLPRQPILVSCGLKDNTLRVHIFDTPSGAPRILRYRSGFSRPPTRIRFCDRDSRQIICGGHDREIRIISLIRDSQNTVFSQSLFTGKSGAQKRKRLLDLKPDATTVDLTSLLPPVVDLAVGDTRRRDSEYSNVVTIHQGRPGAYLWRLEVANSFHKVLLPLGDLANRLEARSVVVSRCGNYAVVGYSNGKIHSFNLQSGRHVGEFLCHSSECAHAGPVSALALDGAGDWFASAGIEDTQVRIWTLRSRGLVDTIDCSCGVQVLVWSRTADLIAAGCDDLQVRVFDAETRRLARKFSGPTATITDMIFSEDVRWLICSSLDASIWAWDLVAGIPLQKIHCIAPAVSLAMSPDSRFLATAHVGISGVDLWSNVSLISPVVTDLGESQTEWGQTKVSEDEALICLSGKPPSYWTTLSHLEVYRRRHRVVKPKDENEEAPFFLPTVKALKPDFAVGHVQEKNKVDSSERHSNKEVIPDLLAREAYNELALYLDSLGPSSIDVEIRTLPRNCLLPMIDFFLNQTRTTRNFEITQAHIGLFLAAWGEELSCGYLGTSRRSQTGLGASRDIVF